MLNIRRRWHTWTLALKTPPHTRGTCFRQQSRLKLRYSSSVRWALLHLSWDPGIRFEDPFWPLVEFDSGSHMFNFSASLVNSQPVCLRIQYLGFLIVVVVVVVVLFCSVVSFIVFHWPWKAPMGSCQLSMYLSYCIVPICKIKFSSRFCGLFLLLIFQSCHCFCQDGFLTLLYLRIRGKQQNWSCRMIMGMKKIVLFVLF